MTRVCASARRAVGVALAGCLLIWCSHASPAAAAENTNPEHGPAALMNDTCGYVLLGLTAPSLVLGLAGVPVPVPVPRPSIAPVFAPACTLFGFPDTQTICAQDAQISAGLLPPPEGRVIDVIDSIELIAASYGAPSAGVADMLRNQFDCQVVPFG
jgi:hypothetical protein